MADGFYTEVTKEQFDEFLAKYPRPLHRSIYKASEPPVELVRDASLGNGWRNVVARIDLWDGSDYHFNKTPEYGIKKELFIENTTT